MSTLQAAGRAGGRALLFFVPWRSSLKRERNMCFIGTVVGLMAIPLLVVCLLYMLTVNEIQALLLGAAIGSIITYWNLTREKRLISSIRSDIELLASFHELTPGKYRQAMNSTKIVTDEEIIDLHNWAVRVKEGGSKVAPTYLAAEPIIFEKILELSRFDAIQVFEGVKDLRDLPKSLDNLLESRVKQ